MMLAALLALALPLAGVITDDPSAQSGSKATRRRVALPEDDPNFAGLLERLAGRAALYREHALGFTCREIVTRSKYDLDTAAFKKSDRTVFDYLLELRPGGTLRELREEVVESKEGVKRSATDFEAPVPPAYLWATLFAKESRARFNFRPAGQVVKAYRLLTLVDFVGISPNPGGNDIAGWSGQVAVDARSLNFWSLEAIPTGQAVRLEAEILRYRRAFAIAGVPLAARPHGWALNVSFGIEVSGLSYPTEQILSMTSLSRSERMSVEEKLTFRYEDYRFFVTTPQSEMTGSEDAPPPPR